MHCPSDETMKPSKLENSIAYWGKPPSATIGDQNESKNLWRLLAVELEWLALCTCWSQVQYPFVCVYGTVWDEKFWGKLQCWKNLPQKSRRYYRLGQHWKWVPRHKQRSAASTLNSGIAQHDQKKSGDRTISSRQFGQNIMIAKYTLTDPDSRKT